MVRFVFPSVLPVVGYQSNLIYSKAATSRVAHFVRSRHSRFDASKPHLDMMVSEEQN